MNDILASGLSAALGFEVVIGSVTKNASNINEAQNTPVYGSWSSVEDIHNYSLITGKYFPRAVIEKETTMKIYIKTLARSVPTDQLNVGPTFTVMDL